uniref:26S proteasome non-ATPase regulatory subunit 2 homolog n=1 Tax=Oryza glumipatula TaxID=40148 RepID=A0A0E0ADX4_9ORYZ
MPPREDPNGGASPSEPAPPQPAKAKGKKKDENKDDDLSEEDQALKEQLELYVVRAQDPDPGVQKLALESMRQEIRSATSSMTSVPKPLKFLRPHYGTLKAYFETMPESDLKKYMADILSVLALTMSAEGERESLNYRMIGSEGDIGSWGHEYVRNLAGEIAQEFQKRQDDGMPTDSLKELVEQIVSFHMKVEKLDLLVKHVDSTNYKRTCLYLTSSSKYLPAPDDMSALKIAFEIYMKFGDFANALRIALLLDDKSLELKQIFTATDDFHLKKQFAFIIARHGLSTDIDNDIAADENEKEALQDIISNIKLSEGYLTLARDIEVMEPKSPEDIYKVHLIDGRGATSSSLDSARQNLAATFVNAFVNAGFGQDKLMTAPSDSSGSGSSGNWLFKNKEHGKASAAASLGMILLWDSDSGLAQLDKYLHSNDIHVVAGALLGIGIVSCGVKSDCDPAFALISEYFSRDESIIRIGAILGLGIAYAGSQKEEVRENLTAFLTDSQVPLEVLVFSAISLGLVFVGSCNEEVAQTIVCVLMERSEPELAEPIMRLLPVALGLLYLGKQESVEATAEVSKTFDEKIRNYCDVTLMSLAYAGTGNVLKVQKLLGICSEHLEKGETHQGPAVLGISLIAMAEELGAEMAVRSLERLLQYGEQNIRRAVPLALGLLCISNPKVRIAQGLVHLGKGLLTLSPYHSDRFLLSPIALAGLVTVLHACLDMKSIILGKYHYMLYILTLAMQPRMLLTVDEDLKPLSVPVRVGQAVDVVGQAGRPKTITGFQTHSTPVLLAAGERAELATEKYLPLTPVLEGFVILRKNPEYHED